MEILKKIKNKLRQINEIEDVQYIVEIEFDSFSKDL